MSFNKLPTEIQQLIVRHIDQADRSYRRRKEEGIAGMTSKLKSRPWGRTAEAFSRVSKGCRQLALPYVIDTLRASKAKDQVFEDYILHTSTMNAITTFVVDLSSFDQTFSLIILYILPQLSNLRRLVIPDISLLVKFDPTMPSKFDKIARNISEWDVKLSKDLEWYQRRVFTNPSAIRSLTVATDSDQEFRLLGSESTSFSAQLARCSSLRKLKLQFNNQFNNNGTTPKYDICHQHSLSRSYGFRQTLTSLDLSFTFDNETAPNFDDVSVLRFASLFSNLRRLRLMGLNFSSNEAQEAFQFPELAQLELLGLDDVEAVIPFLAGKTIPKLKQLELGMVHYFDLANDVCQCDSLSNIADALKQSLPTLTSLRLHHNEGAFANHIWELKDRLYCTVETSWREGISEDLHPYEFGGRDTAEIALDGLEGAVEDIVDWTEETYKRLVRQRDVTGLRGLWKELRGLQEYRKWMED